MNFVCLENKLENWITSFDTVNITFTNESQECCSYHTITKRYHFFDIEMTATVYTGERRMFFLPSLFVYFKRGIESLLGRVATLDLHHYCYCTVIVIRDMNHECLKVFFCTKKLYFSCSMAHFHPFLKKPSPSCLLEDTCYAKTWIQTRPLTA